MGTDRESEIAERALALIAQGGAAVEEAALLLSRQLHTRVRRYFERHRVPEDVAVELVSDVWMKLIASRYYGQARPVVWLWMVARSVLLDWVAHDRAHKRGGSEDGGTAVTTLDDEAWSVVTDTTPLHDVPGWLKICVARAMEQLLQDDPKRAEVLRFVYEGWSAEEIASYYGAEHPVSDREKAAARSRVAEATRKARGYFSHCRED